MSEQEKRKKKKFLLLIQRISLQTCFELESKRETQECVEVTRFGKEHWDLN